jgi:hypothetical protein
MEGEGRGDREGSWGEYKHFLKRGEQHKDKVCISPYSVGRATVIAELNL